MKILLLVPILLALSGSAMAASISVSCSDNPKGLNQIASGQFQVVCPVNCTAGSVWGTNNTFTTDSAICVAAVHEGLITSAAGGQLNIKILPGQPSYAGQMKNGVLTQSWQSYDSSFSISK